MILNLIILLFLLYFIPVVLCLWYTKDKKNVDKKLCFLPKKWFSFAFGYFVSTFLKKHIFEQLLLRVYNDNQCNACWNNNKCSVCGCNRTKFLVPWESCDREDENGWGNMILSETEYNEFRKKYPVDIEVTINYRQHE